jgi:hypothetical protein
LIEASPGFGKIEQSTQSWLGEWWAFGEHEYGERKKFVEAEPGRRPAGAVDKNFA